MKGGKQGWTKGSIQRVCGAEDSRRSVESHGLFDFSNGTTWVQALWTGLGTVHDGVASVQGHGVLQHFLSGLGGGVSGIHHPSVGLHQDGRTEVFLLVPPVGRTGGGTTSTKNTFVQTVQLGSVLDTLQVFSFWHWFVRL